MPSNINRVMGASSPTPLLRFGILAVVFALCVTWFSATQMDYNVASRTPGICKVNHQVFGYAAKYRYTPDSSAYLTMASGYPFDIMIPPYKYRVLTPTLTALMWPLIPSAPYAMEFLTLVFLWAFYTVTAWTLLSMGVGVVPILLGFIGTLSFWHVYLYQNPWSPDALFFLCASLLILSVGKRWYWMYLPVAAAGMMNKETLLFLTPLWLLVHRDKKGILAVLAGLGMYLLPRVQDPPGVSAWYFNNYVPPVVEHIVHHFPTFLLTVLWAWGLVWVIGFLGARKNRVILWAWLLMFAGACIACIGGADHGRMMASMSPVMFPAISLFFRGVKP